MTDTNTDIEAVLGLLNRMREMQECEDDCRCSRCQAIAAITSLRAEVATSEEIISELYDGEGAISNARELVNLRAQVASQKQNLDYWQERCVAQATAIASIQERLQSIENICDRAGKGSLHALSALLLIGNVIYTPPLPPITEELK